MEFICTVNDAFEGFSVVAVRVRESPPPDSSGQRPEAETPAGYMDKPV